MPTDQVVLCPLCGSRVMAIADPLAGVIYQQTCSLCGREYICQYGEIRGGPEGSTELELLQILQVFGERYRLERKRRDLNPGGGS